MNRSAQISVVRHRRSMMACTALATCLGMPAGVNAQTAPPTDPAATAAASPTSPAVSTTAPEQSSGLQEIIVTAQKREQRLQDVPVAITAITAASLQSNRVQSVTDLSSLAPNVVVRPAAGGTAIPAFSSRGLVSYGVVPGSDKEFSIYLDGVYIGSSRASQFTLPDIERVEVLRGPQGTLFGRNATTGAASIVTRDPSGEFGVQQEVTVGNYNQFRSRTSVDLPTLGDFSGYVSFVHDERRGDIKNLGAGTVWDRTGPNTGEGVQTSPKYLGNRNENTVFVAAKYEPSDSFKTTYKFDFSANHFTPNGVATIGYNPGVPLLGSLLQALITSQPTPYAFDTSARRPKEVNNSYTTPGFQKNYGHNLTSELRLADDLTLKNIASYRYASLKSNQQLDGLGGLVFTPQAVLPSAILAAFSTLPPASAPAAIPGYAAFFATKVGQRYTAVGISNSFRGTQYSDELQANYNSSLLTLTSGLLFFHQHDRSGGPPGISNNYAFTTTDSTTGRIPLGNEAYSVNNATSLAAYTQAEVHLASTLDLVAGGRVTRDKKSGTFFSGGTYVFPVGQPTNYTDGTYTGITATSFRYRKTKFTYSVGANYKPTSDLLVYAKYSTGFVSGGSIGPVGFAPETVKSEEGGVKADLFDRHVTANIALFNADYSHVQGAQSGVNVGQPMLGTVVIDQGKVRARGFEFEMTAAPVRGVRLGGSLGYTNTKYKSVNPLLLRSNGGTYPPILLPKYTANLSGQYTTEPLFGDAVIVARVDANWRAKERTLANVALSTTVPSFANVAYSPASWVVNTRVALRNIGPAHLEIAFWARNLNNNRAPLFPLQFSNAVALSDFQPARTFGVDIGIKF